MRSVQKPGAGPKQHSAAGLPYLIIGMTGTVALAGTYILAGSGIGGQSKIAVLTGIVTLYLLTCAVSFLMHQFKVKAPEPQAAGGELPGTQNDALRNKLLAIDDANEFFSACLEPSDMFRLVSSRVAEIFPFATSAFLVPDESKMQLAIVYADGKNAAALKGFEIAADASLAGKAAASGAIEIDVETLSDAAFLREGALDGFRSAIAIPLMDGEDVFGVFQLYSDSAIEPDDETLQSLRAVGEKVSPLFRNSISMERSVSSALTDSLTGLPNERAFYMVLENQLAESQRYRDERPLTVLTLDIKDFAKANEDLGHALGDRILTIAATRIKGQLRKMDFLARSMNDEFVVILPTASEKTALEIMERINTGFAANPFELTEDERIGVWLNFGWATFWRDGETAEQLLRNARLRKRQAKSADPPKVLWFPKEYVN